MKNQTNGKELEKKIGQFLRYGVLLSSFITFIGGLLYLYQHHGNLPNYAPTAETGAAFGVAGYLRELSSILPQALAFDGAAIIQLGVIVLIATPVFRIIASGVVFLVERDYLYVVISLVVLAIIIANMFWGSV